MPSTGSQPVLMQQQLMAWRVTWFQPLGLSCLEASRLSRSLLMARNLSRYFPCHQLPASAAAAHGLHALCTQVLGAEHSLLTWKPAGVQQLAAYMLHALHSYMFMGLHVNPPPQSG